MSQKKPHCKWCSSVEEHNYIVESLRSQIPDKIPEFKQHKPEPHKEIMLGCFRCRSHFLGVPNADDPHSNLCPRCSGGMAQR